MFSTADRPEQVYKYYEGALTGAGWTSLVAQGVQDPPPNPTSGIGLSGPRMYNYDPTPQWLRGLTNGNIGGYVATMTVQARPTSSTGGSEVVIVLHRNER
jgi:hypothetical protein